MTTAIQLHRETADQRVSLNVKTLVKRAKIKQQDLARAVGIPAATLSRRLNNQQAWLFSEVAEVATFFGVTVEELSGDLPSFIDWAHDVIGTASGTRTPNPLIWSIPERSLKVVKGGLTVDRRLASVRTRHLAAVS